MWRRLSRIVTTAVLAATLWPGLGEASYLTVSDDALAQSSAAAVRGRVVALSSSWDTAVDTLYTYVTLDVTRSWGLEGAPLQVVVKQLGGLVGDTALVIGGQAQFEVGEDVLVFLDVRPRDRTLSVAGLEQGKWTMSGLADPAAAFSREVHGNDPSEVVSRDYRAALDLEALAALAGTRVRATGAVLRPVLADPSPSPGTGRGGAEFSLLVPATPARWHQADTGAPVYVDSQFGGHPQFAGGGLTQLLGAVATWTASGSLNLQPGIARGPRCFSNSEPMDGRISVSYGDPCGEIADDSGSIARGGAYFSSSDVRIVNGVSYWKMVKGIVVTDNVPTKFSWMSTGCYEDVLTHELGHVIGFGHAAARPAMMYPSIDSNCVNRSVAMPLQADDLTGMAALYPGVVTPITLPGTPTGLGASVAGSTVTITWTAPATGSAPTSYQLRAGSAPGASNYGGLNAAGTALVVPNVPNGVYYIRVVALNAAGTGAPSSDYVVTVGPALPGAPRSVVATSGPGGTVFISWQPPASGGAPANYVLVAGLSPGATTYQIPVNGTSFAASGVGAGTYYLRIVAVNGAGVGPATAETSLVVP